MFKRTGWYSLSYDANQFIEVLPLDDTRKHLLGDECWCVPRVEQESGGLIIVHNVFDGREIS